MESNYPFTAYWKLFASNGAQVTFGVGSADMSQHFQDVTVYMNLLERAGYSVQLPGLEAGDEKYTVDAWVLGETSKDEPCVFLYSPGLKWRVATVYVEKLDALPFPVNVSGSRWMGSAPEREMAEKKKALHIVPQFEIVMTPTGKTNEETGRPYTKFSHVWGGQSVGPQPTGERPAQASGGACPECHAPAGKPHATSCSQHVKLQAEPDPASDADEFNSIPSPAKGQTASAHTAAQAGKLDPAILRKLQAQFTATFNGLPNGLKVDDARHWYIEKWTAKHTPDNVRTSANDVTAEEAETMIAELKRYVSGLRKTFEAFAAEASDIPA